AWRAWRPARAGHKNVSSAHSHYGLAADKNNPAGALKAGCECLPHACAPALVRPYVQQIRLSEKERRGPLTEGQIARSSVEIHEVDVEAQAHTCRRRRAACRCWVVASVRRPGVPHAAARWGNAAPRRTPPPQTSRGAADGC